LSGIRRGSCHPSVAGNGETGRPQSVIGGRRRELIEVDCSVRYDFRTCPREGVRGCACSIHSGYRGQGNHVEIVPSHELDVHRLPYAGGIRGPGDRALGT